MLHTMHQYSLHLLLKVVRQPFFSCENMQIAIEKSTCVLVHLYAFLIIMDPELNGGEDGLGMHLNTINFVFKRNRYLQPPSQWITCALESRELLAICLKKLKQGLSKVTLISTTIAMEHWSSGILEHHGLCLAICPLIIKC